MNGTLKSLLGIAGLWMAAGLTWMFVVGISAVAAGPGMGTALTLAMAMAWGSALVLSLSVVWLGKVLMWKWMPEGGGRVPLLLLVAAAQGATFLMQAFSVFVIFNR